MFSFLYDYHYFCLANGGKITPVQISSQSEPFFAVEHKKRSL
ncbi:hypothetical protein EAL2_c07670 [Peptoclostridium acidaminophilum DSM 3953]|uniref:Uncharacterized protein n=1 Tax=Peptoclostridium acidaminophilum DSM 3953 TaxID=1286171 RepID=W8TIN1_PEPAC|nr:hypothetical protein EAL2_c07670 [Peptoclostridium acidaminophilum DSM 3953]